MERLNRGRLAGAGLGLFLSWGCTASVSSGGGQPGTNPTPGGAGSGPVGMSSGTGGISSGTGGAGMVSNPPPGTGGTVPGTTPPITVPPVIVAPDPPANPGYMVVRRLNRPEYNNTVADLLGTKLTPATGFPGDDLGAQFDTVGSALNLAPEYVVSYESAATTLINDLFADVTRQKTVVTCDVTTGGDACAKTILTAFARRAWRRPVTADEATGLMAPVTAAKTLGLTPVDGIKAALTGVLISPFFLYKLEMDPAPLSGAVRRLDSYELATRLSYALWSTMPDPALSAAADAGQLVTDAQVTAQVNRMLADPRADRLLDNFTAKWLDFGVDAHEAEAMYFPKFTPALAASMQAEARRYMQEFLKTPTLNVSAIVDARFTFVDATLAAFYGLARTGATSATELVKVDTTGTQRQGLLTLGAFLTTTSYANRTSPVRRGEYVFARLLCSEIPAPPPDVPQLSETPVPGQTLRQRLEAHRAKPECSPCHNLMDPIGFGLESYDGIGSYRTIDSGAAVDSKGVLPDGTAFSGAVELGALLARDARVPQCVTEKFMTFAIGRLLNQPDDRQWIGYLSARAQATDGSMPSLIRAVLLSDAFRSRKAGVRL